MGFGKLNNGPWINSADWSRFQIGQCRIRVHLKRTHLYYESLSKITDSLKDQEYEFFNETVNTEPLPLFELFKSLKIDTSKLNDEDIDSISYINDLPNESYIGFMGCFFVFGHIEKTTKKTRILNPDGSVNEVYFKNGEFGKRVQLTIKQLDNQKMMFEFYVELRKNS